MRQRRLRQRYRAGCRLAVLIAAEVELHFGGLVAGGCGNLVEAMKTSEREQAGRVGLALGLLKWDSTRPSC